MPPNADHRKSFLRELERMGRDPALFDRKQARKARILWFGMFVLVLVVALFYRELPLSVTCVLMLLVGALATMHVYAAESRKNLPILHEFLDWDKIRLALNSENETPNQQGEAH